MDSSAILRSPEHLDDQCDECEKLDRGAISGLERFSSWIAPHTLFVLDYDPFAIYKGTHKQKDKRYELYTSPELRIGLGPDDRRRERWRKIKLFLLVYLTMRHGLATLIQVVAYNKIYNAPLDGEESSGQPTLTTATATTTRQILAGENFGDKLEMALIRLGLILGNPLSALTGISLFISASIIICTLYSLGYMAHQFSVVPMDAVNLRLYLSPEREFRRVDRVIRSKIDYILMNLDICRAEAQQQKVGLGSYPPPRARSSRAQLCHAKRRPQAVRAPVILPLSICAMRPIIYTQGWFRTIQTRTCWTFISIIVWALPVFAYYAPRTIYTNAKASLCRQIYYGHNATTCRWNDVFSVPDIVALVELQVEMILVAFIVTVQIIMVVVNLWTQFDITHDIAADFRLNLQLLRAEQASELTRQRGRGRPDRKSGQANNEHYELGLRIKTDTVLFRSLIKAHVTLVDFRTNSCFITHQVESVLCVLMVSIVLLLLAEHLKGLDVRLFRQLVLSASIMIANAIMLSSANCYNHMCQLEKLGWSILAELARRRQRSDYLAHADCEFIPVFWRKLIRSSGMADKTNSIYPFGVCINYRNTLQFNFLLVSFFSILKTF